MSATKPQPVPAASESDLPEGWREAPFDQLLSLLESGSRPKGGVRGIAEGIPSIGGEHLDERGGFRLNNLKYVPSEFFAKMNRGHVQPGDILIVKDGATTGKVSLVRDDFPHRPAVVNEHVFVCRPTPPLEPAFLFYFVFGGQGQARLMENFRGSAQGGINQAFAPNTIVPVAPLAEQERIVRKVEQLLARVNATRERLARVPAILKRFRQAVLAAACSGRLTTDWREQHPKAAIEPDLLKELPRRKKKRARRLWGAGVVPELTEDERDSLPETWRWVKVREVGTYPDDTVQVGPMSMRSMDFAERGVPVLNVGCVQWGWFDESKLDYMPEDIAKHFERYRIAANDILFTRSGTVGRCAVASDRQHGSLMTFHLLRVRPDSKRCLPLFLRFVFQGATHIKRQTEEAAIGSTRAGFNTNLLAGLDVPLPPLDEQQEIVRRVEALFNLADAIENQVVVAAKRAGKLAQAILAKAFRGELVPTEAELARREGRTYEPAPALLARIQRERSRIGASQAGGAHVRSRRPPGKE